MVNLFFKRSILKQITELNIQNFLNDEFARLLSVKKAAYNEYKKIRKEMQDYQIAKQNVESFYTAQQSWDAEEDLKKKRQQQR